MSLFLVVSLNVALLRYITSCLNSILFSSHGILGRNKTSSSLIIFSFNDSFLCPLTSLCRLHSFVINSFFLSNVSVFLSSWNVPLSPWGKIMSSLLGHSSCIISAFIWFTHFFPLNFPNIFPYSFSCIWIIFFAWCSPTLNASSCL